MDVLENQRAIAWSRLEVPTKPEIKVLRPEPDVIRAVLDAVHLTPAPSFQPYARGISHLSLARLWVNGLNPPPSQGGLQLLRREHLEFAADSALAADLRGVAAKAVLAIDPRDRIGNRRVSEVEGIGRPDYVILPWVDTQRVVTCEK